MTDVSLLIQRRGRRKLCVGDLRDRIILQQRDLTEPAFGATRFEEKLTRSSEVWASIKTTTGKAFFAGVGTDLAVTHEIGIRHDPEVTVETWIELLDGRRLDIVAVEDLEERGEFLMLRCVDRGSKDQEASRA